MDVKKIVWAVDSSDLKSPVNKKMAEFFKSLDPESKSTIIPVSVLSLGGVPLAGALTASEKKAFKDQAIKNMNKILSNVGLKKLKPILLVTEENSLSAITKTIIDFAKTKKASAIALGKSQKNAVDKFLVGSFAETMMFTCKLPLFVVGPKTKVAKNIQRILFSTDLGPSYRKDFFKILKFSEWRKTHITLFNYFGLGTSKDLPIHIKNLLDERKKKALKLADMGADSGLDVGVDIKLQEGDIVKSLLKSAEKNKCQIITIKGKADKLSAFFIGSTTRKVIRQSNLPVMVIH